ncbi:MAG: VOC family protein [Thermoanaerobaculia bacterium]
MKVTKLTPNLLVEAIEPSLPFWEAAGFEATTRAPHGDRLGFVILSNGAAEVMLQTFASVHDDAPQVLGSREPGSVALFLEVDDVRAFAERLSASPVVVPIRKTEYGSTEFFVREPGGHLVGFAQFGE